MKALVLTNKTVSTAPRVLRELRSLSRAGWSVDTVGYGPKPSKANRHFEMRQISSVRRFVSYLVPAHRLRFELTIGAGFRGVKNLDLESYDLVIVHEPSLFPLRPLQRLSRSGSKVRYHLDLHENHLDSLGRSTLEKLVFDSYRRWELHHLDTFLSRVGDAITLSSCSSSISDLYSKRWKMQVHTVRNAPSLLRQSPSAVSTPIKLVHHGVATRDRFLEEYIQALAKCRGNFELHFYLLGSAGYRSRLRRQAKQFGVSHLVHLHDPVPTMLLPKELNAFDVGLVVIPPVTENERLALPNKLFESAQARLALISGPNTDMKNLIEECGNGIILGEWSVEALVASLNRITIADVTRLKRKSDNAAFQFSDEQDQITLESVWKLHLERLSKSVQM